MSEGIGDNEVVMESLRLLLGANCQEGNPALLTPGVCVLMVLWYRESKAAPTVSLLG